MSPDAKYNVGVQVQNTSVGGEKKSNSICVQLGAISSQPRFRTEVLAALMPSSSSVRLVLHVLRLLSNKRPIGDQGVCSKTKEQTI